READPVGAAELGEVLGLARVVPRRTFAPPTVPVFGRPVPLVAWLAMEDAIEASLAQRQLQPAEALAHLRRELADRVGAPLEAPVADRARIAQQACLLALEHVLGQVAQQ